ncbi:hypothetical protein BJX64DRAFT_294387 [Aspergillus heterothallicus]
MALLHLSHLDHATDSSLTKTLSQHGLHAEAHIITDNERGERPSDSSSSSAFVKINDLHEVDRGMELIKRSHVVGPEVTAQVLHPTTHFVGQHPEDAYDQPSTP